MRALAVSAALLFLAILPLRGQTPPATADLVRLIQAHYDTVKDFKADFTQIYSGGGLSKGTRTETGDVRIKKPGRMWWRYRSPEKREYVADGSQLYEFDPADNSVARTPMNSLDPSSTPLLFLAGRGNLVRDFTAKPADAHPTGQWLVNLTPTSPQPDFADLTLRVNRRSYAIEGLVTHDPQGGTSDLRFLNLRENTGLNDSDFIFRMPKGAVIK